MKTTIHALLAVALLGLAASAAADDTSAIAFNFDVDKPGGPPKGFEFGRTGRGAPGKWLVQAVKDAPSGSNVLVQTDTDDTDYRFAVAYAGPAMKDLRLSVNCKPVGGQVDQGCGLVFRLKDADNYYLTRANALEDNVCLYHVVKGNRRQIASFSGKVKSGVWHELATEAKGDHLQVYFDGKKIMDAHDKTFTNAGKFGLWTKADSLIHFDDLSATPM
jgi:hypothetical protein